MTDILTQMADARRDGQPFGITSVCSAHPVVLRAAIRRAAVDGSQLLIEATCNQVNHLGGYTGMTPAQFVQFVTTIAEEERLPPAAIIFGGDHLGPNPWRKEMPDEAMAKAEKMVEAYVAAGFRKIHLDASMGCLGEPAALEDGVIATRAARLAKVAENTAAMSDLPMPLYVLGTEVPIPGGADHALTDLQPTSPEAAKATIAVHRDVFAKAGLQAAFDRVIAFVVQPGVEFGNENVIGYQPARAAALAAVLDDEPQFVFEAHSTDYQDEAALAALVGDGFPILKVGPWLTFAFREAAFALDMVASEVIPGYGDRPLAAALDQAMLAAPDDWQGHYHGDENALRLQRRYSYSDRSRYYWGKPAVKAALQGLADMYGKAAVPETVLHQYLPRLPDAAAMTFDDILIASVDDILRLYGRAAICSPTQSLL